jgi:hypothetical protein
MEGKHTLAILLGILLLIASVRMFWKSDGDYPPMGYVTGTISMDGKPLSGVMVAFYPEKGRPSTAVADGDGRYELRYTRNVTGSKVGPSTVHLSWETGTSGPAIPERYGLNKSELTAIVEPGNNVFDFYLQSDQAASEAAKAVEDARQAILD